MVLGTPAAVAWATGGLSVPIDRTAALDPLWVVVHDGRATVVASSVEVERVTGEGDLGSLGFSLASAPWFEPGAARRVAEEIAGPSSRWISDGVGGADVSDELVASRLALGDAEVVVLEALADIATSALEGALEAWRPGRETDRDIAARVVEVVEAAGADAVCLIVGADDRVRRYRHPLMVGAVARELVMAVIVARGLGLHAAATRLVACGEEPELTRGLSACHQVDEAVRAASVPGATWGEAYEALGRAYAASGHDGAWRDHFQGGPIGYAQREFELCPEGPAEPWFPRRLAPATAVAWNPSLAGGAKIEDTYLVGEELRRLGSARWPRVAGPDSGAGLRRVA